MTLEGTIEADTLAEAQKKWDDGFEPPDEQETDRDDDQIKLLEEKR